MSIIKAVDDLYYVGVLDKELRVFDIIMETEDGTTYNSYILKGGSKTVLFEAVKSKFCDIFFKNIEEVCPLTDIDYIVVSHTEPDHSGCLEKLLELATNATVLAGQTAINFLGEIINQPFPHKVVTEKDVIDIGGMSLSFLSVPMLHWPDTIFTWVKERGILFTCDCFGCHYADNAIFNDAIGKEKDFTPAYKYYFDNIIGPYAYPHMLNALEKTKDLEIKFIANGHGPVLRTDIEHYLNLYRDWSQKTQTKNTVAIAYVSAYGYTKSLALEIKKGLEANGIKQIKMFDLVEDSMEDACRALSAADGILLGSPTLVGDALPPIYEVMIGLNPIIHRGKFAGAFGSYGWSGEATHNIAARLNQLHMALPLPEMRVRLKPTSEDLNAAFKFGQDFAEAMLESK